MNVAILIAFALTLGTCVLSTILLANPSNRALGIATVSISWFSFFAWVIAISFVFVQMDSMTRERDDVGYHSDGDREYGHVSYRRRRLFNKGV